MAGGGWMLMALIAGVLIAVQGAVYTRMTADMGGAVPAALVAFVLAAIVLLAILTAAGQALPTICQIRTVPAWAWPGSVAGVAVVLISVTVIPRIGLGSYLVAAIAGQVVAGWMIDRYAVFGGVNRDYSVVNITGLILVIAGAVLVRLR